MRRLQGTIVSNKMKKTLVVRVDTLKRHPKYQKFYRISKKFKAHGEEKDYRIGDIVIIEETRPLSRDKRWRVASIVRRAEKEVDESTESF